MNSLYYRFNYFKPVSFTDVSITDKFWKSRIEINHDISLPLQYKQLKKSGVIDNFKNVINQKKKKYNGLFFSDSDAYKWIEAVCYSSAIFKDQYLEKSLNEIINLIINSQEPDGYINTYFQIMEPEKKFSNLGVCHELYTGAHLILAGIAHNKINRERKLFDVACKFADLIDNIFGEGKFEAIDGHAGIEMALIELYKATSNLKYLKLAEFFINQRGNPDSRLRWELNHLDEIAGNLGKPGRNNTKKYGSYEKYNGSYAQDHLPVREQTEAVGHAVRAMYLYCGMADLYSENGDSELLSAMKKIWQNIVTKKMYITGGIGSSILNEGFTEDYDLSNENACSETCAAYGIITWSQRMLNITGNGMYADVIERVLYNSFLAGVSLDGKKYFYNNPLKSMGKLHRELWYECACCPPNIARLLVTIGNFIYSQYEDGIAINQYIQSESEFKLSNRNKVTLNLKSNFPWDGKIKIFFHMDKSSEFSLSLRIPEWCQKFTIKINNKQINYSLKEGYLIIRRYWKDNDSIKLELKMSTMHMVSHPLVLQNQGKIAIQRGPLVYCLEQSDHNVSIEQIIIPDGSALNVNFIPDLLGGVNVIDGIGLIPNIEDWNKQLYKVKDEILPLTKIKFRTIPYYAWNNRKPGHMIVCICSM